MWEENPTLVITLALLIILLVLALIWTALGSLSLRREWQFLARELGLKLYVPTKFWEIFTGKMPSIIGKVGGLGFYCDMQARHHGRERVTYTHVAFDINVSADKTLSIYIEEFFAKIGKVLGGQDVEFNHPAFDDSYMIKANDESFALHVLNKDVRELILSRLDLQGELKIEGAKLIYEETWTVKYAGDGEKLRLIIAVLFDIAKAINNL